MPRKVTTKPNLRRGGPREQSKIPRKTKLGPRRILSGNRPGLDKAERVRPIPSRSYGTEEKSEKARIEAEEMFNANKVHYMCFGEFLSFLLLLNHLNEQKRPKNTVLL